SNATLSLHDALPISYVIDVIVSSLSPEKAARLSNAVAEAFITSQTEAKQNAARQANLLIARQIDDLQAKSREADERLEAYRKERSEEHTSELQSREK